MKAKRRTNQQLITHICRTYGPMAEIFIMDAIGKLADRVSVATPAECENALISGQAWVQVAKEIKRELDSRP